VGRGEVRFCALVIALCGNNVSATTVKSSRITGHLLLLVRII
jgi:hypothetical protein